MFEIHVNYGKGYEYVCTEHTMMAARATLRLYAENSPEYSAKCVCKRHRKSDYTEGQLAEIQAAKDAAFKALRDRWAAKRAQKEESDAHQTCEGS